MLYSSLIKGEYIMPTNDSKMIYNLSTHRYVLTIDGASEIGDVTIAYGDNIQAERTLKSISRTIYNYIFSHANRANRNIVEYWIATNAELRDAIYQAMCAQLEADLSSGQNDVKNQAGINFETNGIIDNKLLKAKSLCIEAQQILENTIPNILYAGSYAFSYWTLFNELRSYDRYERLGY